MKLTWEEFQLLQPDKAEALRREYSSLEASEFNLEFELLESQKLMWKAVDKTRELKGPWFWRFPDGWVF